MDKYEKWYMFLVSCMVFSLVILVIKLCISF